jgi:hypothetical protein
MATANEQLAAAVKAAAEATAKVEELKKQSRDADLETVKALIKTHGFGPTDLRGVLKAKRKRSTAAKKTTGTPRKSTAKKK